MPMLDSELVSTTTILPTTQPVSSTNVVCNPSEIRQTMSTNNQSLPSIGNASADTINMDFIRSGLSIKCIQINLQHAKAAVAQLTHYAVEREADLIFVQEPYIKDGLAVGFPLQWSIFQTGDLEKPPRAIIINCNKDWKPTVVAANRDNVAILLDVQETSMLFISQYSSPSESILPSLTFLSTTLQRIKIPLQFIVGDYNAHNTTWGYASTDEKGHSLEDFLSAHHLILHNSIDAPPTFDRIHSRGWPDLTISSTSAASLLQNWTVEDEISLSDHRYITFTIAQPTTIQIIRRYNLPGKRIRAFTDRVKALVNDLDGQLSSANTRADLENFTVVLQKGLQQICNDLLPQRHAKKLK
ncbi:uncharacterized protein LOC118202769 [Stegodyphus dumicola]|uniref:uncharacterized protein LOC118202769 n=1 Tax=Stegodyphus dumicola TaxID=202533 RepID=UPI0015B104D3|nr:uncharacterized protein LOC118202769 [Stegodyphus dumicola]